MKGGGQGSATPGGYSWAFLVGVCRPVLRILTLFPTKKCHFSHHLPHPFSDLEVVTKRNMRVNIDRNYVIITEIRTLAKGFLSYSFIIERRTHSYTTVVPLWTIPHSRPKWAKSISVLRPKRRHNHTLRGGTYLYGGLYKGVPGSGSKPTASRSLYSRLPSFFGVFLEVPS